MGTTRETMNTVKITMQKKTSIRLLKTIIFYISISFGLIGIFAFTHVGSEDDGIILSHTIDLKKQTIEMYWKDEYGRNFYNFRSLNKWLSHRSEKLVFAINGGMFDSDLQPHGLFIEGGIIKKDIDKTKNGYGNFYMQHNGVFYITNDNKGVICKTEDFDYTNVKYATQSGPMLVIDGKINSHFRYGSKNLNIRNGVGILPNGEVVFAISKAKINFYDFANYFKSLGCKNALYLDGAVSKMYLPEMGNYDMAGTFGVIIGETKKIK